MFCGNCGAQIPDNAAFCPSCGAKNLRAQSGGTAQPQQPTRQQPVQQPQQGGWQQPQQPVQQQNNWQQPQQNWQPQQQNGWQQGNAYQAGQGMAYGAAPVKTKKRFPTAIAAMLVVVLGVFAVVRFTPVHGIYMRSFAAPQKYYKYVEKDSVEELASTVSSTYDNLVASSVATEDQSVNGELTIQLGDEARTLLVDALGSALDEINEGDDLSWLKSLSVAYEVNRKDEMGSIGGKLRLNGTDIITLDGVLELETGKIWLAVPELSTRYIETSLEELDLDDLDINLGSLFSAITSMDMKGMDPVMQALPDADVMEKLIKKYLDAAVECLDDVKKENGTLSVEGVSADYTVMTITIDGETMEALVKEIGPMLKDDRDLKEIIIDVADAVEEDGQQSYDEFISMIDEVLEDADDISENMDEEIVMTVYTDGSGEVHGRVIEVADMRIELLMPEKSGKFGLRLSVSENGTEEFLLLGSGKRNGSKLTGTMDVEVEGAYFGVVELDGFDDEKIKEGQLVGAITLKPSAELWDMASDIPSSVVSILEDVEFRLDMNTSKNKTDLTLTASTGGKMLISIAYNAQTAGSKNVSTVSGVAPEEWAEDITLDKLEKVVESIERAGVPQAYTDLLDEALESSF